MNKQLVNLIGGVAALAIMILGIVVFAVPQYTAANATNGMADGVAASNASQQAALDALTTQAADTTQLDADVARLRAEIPTTEHLDDVLLLAVQAAQAAGGTVTALTPGSAEAFAARTADPAVSPAPGAPAAPAPAPAARGAPADSNAAAGGAAGAAGTPHQIPLTVTIDAPDVPSATRILDALRSGKRLVAVQQGMVVSKAGSAPGAPGGVTLTAALLAFARS